MKLLTLFLLLTLVTPIMASDEPMRIGCFKYRVEAYFTGRGRMADTNASSSTSSIWTHISFSYHVAKANGRTNIF